MGAMLALAAGMAWFWAPICAALSCAGGGVLRDVLVNQEPHTFKGVIYEEAAIVGGLVLTGDSLSPITMNQARYRLC